MIRHYPDLYSTTSAVVCNQAMLSATMAPAPVSEEPVAHVPLWTSSGTLSREAPLGTFVQAAKIALQELIERTDITEIAHAEVMVICCEAFSNAHKFAAGQEVRYYFSALRDRLTMTLVYRSAPFNPRPAPKEVPGEQGSGLLLIQHLCTESGWEFHEDLVRARLVLTW